MLRQDLTQYETMIRAAVPAHIKQSAPSYLKARTQSVALLREWLNPKQLEQYDRTGTFTVFGEATGTCYLINGNMTMFNVSALVDDCFEPPRLCFVPKGGLPIGDLLLEERDLDLVVLDLLLGRIALVAERGGDSLPVGRVDLG